MAGPLKNERYERMAQEMAKGEDQCEAHRLAGYSGTRSAASELLSKRPEIHDRVAELLERAAARTEITIADIAKQLDEDREFARGLKQSATMVTATMGKAKVLGLLRDQVEHSGAVKVFIAAPDAHL